MVSRSHMVVASRSIYFQRSHPVCGSGWDGVEVEVYEKVHQREGSWCSHHSAWAEEL